MSDRPDSWAAGSRIYRDLVAEHVPEDEELERGIVELVREHRERGVRQFVGDTIAKHEAAAERNNRKPAEFRRLLRRALLTNEFPPRLSGMRDVAAETREYLRESRELPHPDGCACGGRGWLTEGVEEIPEGAEFFRHSFSGASIYHCPGGAQERGDRWR